MNQRAVEPLLTTVTEGVSTSTPLTLILTPSVSLATLGFPPFVSGGPLRLVGLGQVYAPLDLIIEATLMTSTCILETVPTASDPQGHIIYGTGPAMATIFVGSHPFGQSMSPPLGSGPSPILQFSIPTDGAPEAQYQCLMELV